MTDEIKLPENWIQCKSKKRPDKVFFFNKKTGESSWTNPSFGESSKTASDVPVLKMQKPKKNIAAERLKRLQTSLKSNQLKSESSTTLKSSNRKSLPAEFKISKDIVSLKVTKHSSTSVLKNPETPLKKLSEFIPAQTSSPLPLSKKPEERIIPNPEVPIKNIANARLKDLQETLEKQQSILEDDIVMPTLPPEDSMDWEDSEQFSSISNNNNDSGTMSEYYNKIGENSFKTSSNNNCFERSYSFGNVYFVVDTNVLLHNLTFVRNLSLKVFGESTTVIMIPYKVIQELDGLKGRESVSTLAIRAIKLLNDKLVAKDPHFQGQNAKHSTEELIPLESNDDEILNCCLQIQKTCKNVILISNDINLRNKAIINEIKVLSSSKADNESILNLLKSTDCDSGSERQQI